MSLKDIVDIAFRAGSRLKDEGYRFKIESMLVDAEKYRLAGEQNVYNYLKRRAVEVYHQINDPKIKKELEETISPYLPKTTKKTH